MLPPSALPPYEMTDINPEIAIRHSQAPRPPWKVITLTFDDFLRQACPPLQLEWRKYRRRGARHRVRERMEELGLSDYAAYLELLRADPDEAHLLPEVMLVTVSRFFREWECWADLGEKVIPTLIGIKSEGTLRAWSVGCCGGEEPYSLAILWLDRLQEQYPGWKLEIKAADIDEASLKRAQEGKYEAGSLREVPHNALQRYFSKENGLWRINDQPKQLVAFQKHNLLNDPPLQEMDIVFCRYLAFTYYRGERRRKADEAVSVALKPGGALVIGLKESLTAAESEVFKPWPGCRGIYRRTSLGLEGGEAIIDKNENLNGTRIKSNSDNEVQ